MPKVSLICQECGRQFSAYPSELSRDRKFCSQQCYQATMKNRYENPEERQKDSEAVKRAYITNPGLRYKQSQAMLKRYQNPLERDKASSKAKKMWQTRRRAIMVERVCELCGKHFAIRADAIKRGRGKFCSKSCCSRAQMAKKLPNRDRLIELGKKHWQDPEYLAMIIKARSYKPNKLEQRLIDILDKYLPQFKYNGDFGLGITIGGKVPDFVNVNGKKQIIELFGDYWHTKDGVPWHQTELGSIGWYSQYGFKCLVIWGSELKSLTDYEIVDKIKSFFTTRKAKTKIRR